MNPLEIEKEEKRKIELKVKAIVAKQLDVSEAEIKTTSLFANDLGADSLDMVELVMAMEDEFGIDIPDEQADKITTVKEAIDFCYLHKTD